VAGRLLYTARECPNARGGYGLSVSFTAKEEAISGEVVEEKPGKKTGFKTGGFRPISFRRRQTRNDPP
jgi:hypothetical protein